MADMTDLILLPSLERLLPHDRKDPGTQKKVATSFGLTFSVALGEGKAPADLPGVGEAFLKPWNWGRPTGNSPFEMIREFVFFSVPGFSEIGRVTLTKVEEDLGSLREALEARYKTFFSSGVAVWGWSQPTATVSRQARPWPAFVGEISVYPYPLPQKLGLSYFLELAQPPDALAGTEVVVAPVMKLKFEGRDATLVPRNLSLNGERVRVAYVEDPPPVTPAAPPADPAAPPPPPPPPPNPAPVLVAETMPCKVDGVASTRYFDFENLWIDMKPEDVAGTDWRAGLELRLAEQLHLARTIVEWMKEEHKGLQAARDKAKKDGTSLDESKFEIVKHSSSLAWHTLLQLREVLGRPGGNKGMEGELLVRAGSLLRTADPFGADTIQDVAAKARVRWSQIKVSTWLGGLREAVTGVAFLKEGKEPLSPEEITGSALLDLAVRAALAGVVTSEGEKSVFSSLTVEQTIAELEQLLAALSTQATLRALFRVEWQLFLNAHPTLFSGDSLDFVKALTKDLPGEIDLQRLLLLDHLAERWRDLERVFTSGENLSDLRKNIQSPYLGILKSLGIPAWQAANLTGVAKDFADRVLPEPKNLHRVEARRTKGLTFQLDTLSTDTKDDRLAQMQGVAVLMRKGGPGGEWRCLNMAATNHGEKNVLLPSRLAYLGDLRSPTVTYDNGPLTVASPLGAAEASGAELAESGKEDKLGGPLVKFTHSEAKIPGLVFGDIYYCKAFFVTNSGALPEPISDGNPWKLKPSITTELDDAGAVKVHYLREVHVGALRFLAADRAGLPQIPPGCAPQIRELSPKQVLPEGDPLFGVKDSSIGNDSLLQTDSMLAQTPLLLLAKGFPAKSGYEVKNRFSFSFLPPTVDLQTWDRWMAKDATKDRRKFVWRSFHQLAFDQGEATRNLEDAGIYLDDPAVDGIWAELIKLDEQGNQVPQDTPKEIKLTDVGKRLDLVKPANSTVKPGPVPIKADFSNWDKATCTLAAEQYNPIPVKCEVAGSKLTVTLGSGSSEKTLSGDGRLFRLSFYVSLKGDAQKRFAETETVERKDGREGTSPWHLLIEIPQPLPADPKVNGALKRELKPEFKADGRLTLSLDMNKLQDLHGLVYRAELQHQVWHWRGRPPAEHPEIDSKGTEQFFQMSEFGERHDDEHRVLPLPRQVEKQREPVFRYEENLNDRGPRGDTRALFHRFSARVFSRWEGILREEDSSLEAIEEGTQSRWQPLFVPCRHVGEVPVPKVKMVLPLTQGLHEPGKEETLDGSPGLMVVVDGSWYEVGGLAEKLEVEVVKVADPKNDPTHPKPGDQEYFQIGTDPIVTAKSAGQILGTASGALSTKQTGNLVEFKDVVGAIGHHRDHSQTDPRFLASSFLLSRPTIQVGGSEKKVDISWWFLKLRFRRTLGAGKGTSDWSAPFWVQVLPGVERVEEDWFRNGSPEIWVDDGDAKRLRVNPALPAPDPNSRFYLFGVMTRKVIDFAGRPDQEAYVGVWVPDGNSWKIDSAIGDRKDLFIRWIEVQSSQKPDLSKGEELWDRLFKADLEDSKRMRIVRISKRFDVKPGRFS